MEEGPPSYNIFELQIILIIILVGATHCLNILLRVRVKVKRHGDTGFTAHFTDGYSAD